MEFSIRPATQDDIPDLARIHIQGWHGAYGGIVNSAALKTPTLDERIRQWNEWIHLEDSGALLAVSENGEAAGFASYGRLKTPPPGSSPIRPLYSGEIYGLYLLPDYYRQGIGTALLKEAARKLREMRHKSLCLWTLEKNKRSVSFYNKMGGERCGKHDIEIGSDRVREVCFGWRDTAVLCVGDLSG